MFKRLRERIAEETTKFPIGQLNNSNKQSGDAEGRPSEGVEDLITLSDSSAVVVPYSSSQQFSIGDEDGAASEQNTPQKKSSDASNGSTNDHTTSRGTPQGPGSDFGYAKEYRPTKSAYIPQSDIESEREDPPTLNLEGISKDQLLTIIDLLKARAYKYKNKYAEVVKNYKELRDEKLKIENTLIEHQDKALRRMAELREQCQLEQKAKAHLEANLRLLMEEKDSRISVLETQINLLKEAGNTESVRNFPDVCDSQNSDSSGGDLQFDSSSCSVPNHSVLQEKLERLDHQINQAKKTITSQTDQLSLLRKQNENLSQELETKVKKLNEIEDSEKKQQTLFKEMQVRLKELQEQQEESGMSMAETKKNMHEELESREKLLAKVKEEAKQLQAAYDCEKSKVSELQKQQEEKVNELKRQLDSTEKMLEEERESLMQELGRGKSAALSLMQQECAKRISAVEEEWKVKLQELQNEKDSNLELKSEVTETKCTEMEEKLKTLEDHVEKLESTITLLENENSVLKSSLENLNDTQIEKSHTESIKCMKDKLLNAEKNYQTQLEEMRNQILQLEADKSSIETLKNELSNFKNLENTLKTKLKSKEDELGNQQEKYESLSREYTAKIHSLQDAMKDEENMVVKLNTNIKSLTQEHLVKRDELGSKIKVLEEEREQLMIHAQERVSKTEAKCREDVKLLQDKNNELLVEIKKLNGKITGLDEELCESRQFAETAAEKDTSELKEQLAAAEKDTSELKEQLAAAEGKLTEAEMLKQATERELSAKLQKLQEDNETLTGKANHIEKLKSEKEELNEKVKQAEKQITSIKLLESERDALRNENTSILSELEQLRQTDPELLTKFNSLIERENKLSIELEELKISKDNFESELSELKSSFEHEVRTLKSENENQLKQIGLLEKLQFSDRESDSVKDYISIIRGECETAIKAKEEELENKLKLLVRDFCIQMDVKDKDCDKMVSELLDKNQDLEDRLLREHRKESSELRQALFEKECALDDVREHYEDTLQKKDKKLKELQASLKKLSENSQTKIAFNDVDLLTAEPSDWDDTWAVPEECIETSSPVQNAESCKEHSQEIESLQEELTKCNSEIKELKILLRLSPPESTANNIQMSSDQSLPEPTEIEYLKNIIFEYMMGKEPITLAKVIAAVLRFSDSQTQQVIRREEARHPTK